MSAHSSAQKKILSEGVAAAPARGAGSFGASDLYPASRAAGSAHSFALRRSLPWVYNGTDSRRVISRQFVANLAAMTTLE